MIYPRVIPSLLIDEGQLIKTKQFKFYKYLGDPINAIKIFNEKIVDELVIFDISITSKELEIDFNLLKNLSNESRMPLCYGGGIKTIHQFEKIINLGIEKVSLSHSALYDDELILESIKNFGSQSTIVTLDIKKLNNKYFIFHNNGSKIYDHDLFEIIKKLQDFGVGEIIFNMIDRDGMKSGYDFEFLDLVKPIISNPISILGGVKDIKDFELVLKKFGLVGLCASSLFTLQGKFDSVLLKYINEQDKNHLNEILLRSIDGK